MPDDVQEQQTEQQVDEQDTSQEQVETTSSDEERPDGFKSEGSKQSVLADLAKARTKAKELEEEIARRDREQLSDIERAQAERDEFRTKWEQAEQARLRSDIARTKGVDPELLTGSNEEEMTAHADRLLAWRGDRPTPPKNPNPAQGTGEKPPISEDDQLYQTLYPQS